LRAIHPRYSAFFIGKPQALPSSIVKIPPCPGAFRAVPIATTRKDNGVLRSHRADFTKFRTFSCGMGLESCSATFYTWRKRGDNGMRAVLTLVGVLGLAAVALPQKPVKPDPFAPITDDPKLPRVLLIGDSISIGYTLPARKLLEGKANVHRIPTNGGPTTNGLKNLDSWLGNGKWDVIHFNWGLHDLRMDADGKHQVPLDEYEKNLRELVKRLKTTKAKLIWCSTTPVPDAKVSPPRKNADVVAYNAVAKKIMDAEGVAINDLYAFAAPRLERIQQKANVHFTPEGSEALAEEVARRIAETLNSNR